MTYQEQMASIEASEHLSLVTVLALGGGNLKKEDSRKLFNQLERTAHGGRVAKKKSRPSPQALASMGIGVVVKPKKKSGGKEQSQ